MNFKKQIATENDDDDDGEMVGRNIHREMDEMINGEDLMFFFIMKYLNLSSKCLFVFRKSRQTRSRIVQKISRLKRGKEMIKIIFFFFCHHNLNKGCFFSQNSILFYF